MCPAFVVCESSFWGPLRSPLFRKCSPESFCVEPKSPSTLKVVRPWSVFLDSTLRKRYSICYMHVLRFESCHYLFFNPWNISIQPICVLYLPQNVSWVMGVVYNYWNLTYIYFYTTIIIIIHYILEKAHKVGTFLDSLDYLVSTLCIINTKMRKWKGFSLLSSFYAVLSFSSPVTHIMSLDSQKRLVS